MMSYKPGKLGQTDVVFGLWSEFISKTVPVGLQFTSLYVQRLRFVPPWLTQTDRRTDRQKYWLYWISLFTRKSPVATKRNKLIVAQPADKNLSENCANQPGEIRTKIATRVHFEFNPHFIIAQNW